MKISYDATKRVQTLKERNLDFEHARELFQGLHFSDTDDRRDYGEERWISVGIIGNDVIVVVWTDREDSRRIISMRKASRDERERYFGELDRPR